MCIQLILWRYLLIVSLSTFINRNQDIEESKETEEVRCNELPLDHFYMDTFLLQTVALVPKITNFMLPLLRGHLCIVDTGCWPFSATSLAELLHGSIYMYFLGLYNKKFGMFASFVLHWPFCERFKVAEHSFTGGQR